MEKSTVDRSELVTRFSLTANLLFVSLSVLFVIDVTLLCMVSVCTCCNVWGCLVSAVASQECG